VKGRDNLEDDRVMFKELLKKIGWEGLGWTDLAWDRDQWEKGGLVNTVMKHWVP
jgi:hypothetical protein